MSTATIATTTLQEHVDLYNALLSVQDLQGLKFAGKVSDNIDRLETALRPLNEMLRPTPEFEAFAKDVHELAAGDPEKVKQMEAEHPELVEYRKKQLDSATVLLNEPFELQLRKIHEGELPHNISARQLRGLKLILVP